MLPLPRRRRSSSSLLLPSLSRWSLSDFRAAWGHLPVVAAFSPDHMFQRGIGDARHGRRLLAPHRQRVGFGEFLDLVEADAARAAAGGGAPVEHVSVQQSPSGDLSEFGLPSLPPLIAEEPPKFGRRKDISGDP